MTTLPAEQYPLSETNGRPLIEVKDNGPSFMQLLQVAITNNSAIDVIERLAALQREARQEQALIDFNGALNRVQKEIKRIAPDSEDSSGQKKWASYAAIDRDIRPIYSKEGFSLSFTHADCPKPDHIRLVCRVALGAHVERPWVDMPVDTKGPKGTDVLTKTDGTKAADSNAKRYLVKDIFNIAIGKDEGDGMDEDELKERIAHFANCRTNSEVFEHWKASQLAAEEIGDVKAQISLMEARDNRRKELVDARAKS